MQGMTPRLMLITPQFRVYLEGKCSVSVLQAVFNMIV